MSNGIESERNPATAGPMIPCARLVRACARRRLFAAAVLMAASMPLAAHGASPAPRLVTLPNGLTVLLAPDSTATAVDVGVWYRAGARAEPQDRSGVAHLLGRLMYRGSRRHPAGEHARLLQAEGATFNTLVHPDYSSFFETIPPAALELALELEADRMRGLRITSQDFEAARAALRHEQEQRGESSLLDRGIERLYAVAFRGDPYGRPVSGLPRDLDRVTLQDVETFYARGFAPENAVLTVVGRFEPALALLAVRRTFGPLQRASAKGEPRPRTPTRTVPEQRGERRETDPVQTQASVLFAGWRAPGFADPDGPALEVLSRVLTGGPSARLPRSTMAPGATILRAQGGFEPGKEAGLLYCVAAVKPEADTAQAERELISQVERLASEPLAATELDRVRRQLESEILFGSQAVRIRAQSLGTAQLLGGDHRLAEARLEKIRSLTPEEVQRAAARVLKPAGRSVVWLVPAAGAPGTEGDSDKGGSR